MVTVTNGELTIDARGTGDNNKAINMTYITIKEAGEKTLAQTDIDALNIPEIATGDIELPTRVVKQKVIFHGQAVMRVSLQKKVR